MFRFRNFCLFEELEGHLLYLSNKTVQLLERAVFVGKRKLFSVGLIFYFLWPRVKTPRKKKEDCAVFACHHGCTLIIQLVTCEWVTWQSKKEAVMISNYPRWSHGPLGNCLTEGRTLGFFCDRESSSSSKQFPIMSLKHINRSLIIFSFIGNVFLYNISWLQFPLPPLLPAPPHFPSYLKQSPFCLSLENRQASKT